VAVASHAEMLIGLHTFGGKRPTLEQEIQIKEKFGTIHEKQWAKEQKDFIEKKQEKKPFIN
jgi:hypothetical protein